jgi:hypothetical protein
MLRLKTVRRGAAAIEYAALLGAVVGAAGIAVSLLGSSARDQFTMSMDPGTPGQGTANTPDTDSGGAPENRLHPMHDNFNGKGDMKWRDDAGSWTTADGARTSSDARSSTITDVGEPDYTYKVTLQTTASTGPDAGDTSRVVFRYQDAQNYYAVVTRKDGVVELAKMQGGEWRPALAYANTKTDAFKANDYQVRVAGNAVEVKVNGETALKYTDPNPVKTGGVGVKNEASQGSITKAAVTPN